MARRDPKDELAGTEAPFVSHLVELRDRLIRALLAVVVVFVVLCVWPGPGGLYDLLAAPMTANLPPGTKLIATNVFSPFLVPLKITLMARVPGGVAGGAVPGVGVRRAGPVLAREEDGAAAGDLEHVAVLHRRGVLLLHRDPGADQVHQSRWRPSSINTAPDIEQYFGTVLTLFLVFGIAFEVPVAVVVLARIGVVTIEQLKKFRGYFVVVAFIVVGRRDAARRGVAARRWRSRCACCTRSASGRPSSSSEHTKAPPEEAAAAKD